MCFFSLSEGESRRREFQIDDLHNSPKFGHNCFFFIFPSFHIADICTEDIAYDKKSIQYLNMSHTFYMTGGYSRSSEIYN